MYPCDFQNPCGKKLENKIIILTKYLLHLKSKLYVQNYNSLYLYTFTILNINYFLKILYLKFTNSIQIHLPITP